jgi:Concanavalin A-like lectin/glucanases superfamily
VLSGSTALNWTDKTIVGKSVLNKERPSSLTYALYAGSDAGQPNVDYTSGGAEVDLNAGSAIPLNDWTHLAGTFDGTTLRLYVNGALIGSKPSSSPIDVTNGVLRIGGTRSFTGEFFPGLIDEVRIYNRALSQQELQTDMITPVVH